MTATTATAEQPVESLGELESELLDLARRIAATQCRFLQLLAEFDRRGGWAGPGVRSCAHWLSWWARMTARSAGDHVRIAHALAKLPQVTEAFAAGRLSYSKVRAITRVAADLADEQPDTRQESTRRAGAPEAGADPPQPDRPQPDRATDQANKGDAGRAGADGGAQSSFTGPAQPRVLGSDPPARGEQTLLEVALAGTASQLETVVRAARRHTADPTRAAARSLSWTWADDGSLVVRGRFGPTDGATLVAAIDAAATLAPTANNSRDGGTGSPDRRHRALERPAGAATDPIGARRADALLILAAATDLDQPGEGDTRAVAETIADRPGRQHEQPAHNRPGRKRRGERPRNRRHRRRHPWPAGTAPRSACTSPPAPAAAASSVPPPLDASPATSGPDSPSAAPAA